MEIGPIGQTHKPALLQDGYVAQLRKQKLVNRRVYHRKHEDHQLKATPGIDSDLPFGRKKSSLSNLAVMREILYNELKNYKVGTAYNGEPKTGLPHFLRFRVFRNTVGSRKEKLSFVLL